MVLGAGMVGTCTALHLQTRGFEVILIDRRSPGLETSYGNAGLIQQEAVEPYAMPRDVGFLMKSALGLGAEHAYQLAHNSFAASFVTESVKRAWQDRLDSFFETFE